MTTNYLNDTLIIAVQLSQFSTGAAFDATGSPAYEVYEDATSTTRATGTLTKTNSKTGYYTGSTALTTGAGFQVGHGYSVRVTATVDGVAASAVVDRFMLRNPITTNSSGYVTVTGNVTVGGYAAGQDPATLLLINAANKLNTDSSGNVTIAGYASGQSPATLVWAAALQGNTAGVASTMGIALGQLYRRFYNNVLSTATVLTVYMDDSATPMLSAVVTSTASSTIKGKAS